MITMTQTGSALERNDQADCIFHVGYPRTGSSFLQTQIFEELDGYVRPTEKGLDDNLRELKKKVDEGISLLASVDRTPIIYSNESIVSTIDGDSPEKAERLHTMFPNGRVVIVIRSQYSIFRSFYHLYVKDGGISSYPGFVSAGCKRLFRYREVVSRYRQLFGPENVATLLYEDLVERPNDFLGELLEFMDCDAGSFRDIGRARVKASVGDLTMRILRWRNILLLRPIARYCPRQLFPVRHIGLPGSSHLERLLGRTGIGTLPLEKTREIIREVYADENDALFNMLGKDVTDYDYPQRGRF